ncbi:Major Facilitator Superfamily protein [Paenibacillus sophorae]|uniref:MFS transporter n=1 Tax=Paenibacillus sophorae TaxID=1333845 RepID=A0A1H8VP12_9BACL|nr:MFS transporter [Paenibacillus sophorae]QWU17599.1 MFS transporter [Paenibacillus sophorae]SEP17074.1 Major Facilitator Superfamily protein [Paenibacillus sophorae]
MNGSISQSRLRLSLFILSVAHVLLGLDFNIVYVALPEIGAELGFSQQTLQWVVSAYIVAFGGFLLLGGRISDLLGKRKTFVNALFIFAAASLMGSFASNAGTVILARAIQGLAGAFLFPSILSLINSLFAAGRERNRALSIWSLAGSSGLALGS